MDIKPNEKWYFKTTTLIITFLAVGPLVLPLIWFNPNIKKNNKILISVIVSVLSLIMIAATVSSIKSIIQYYGMMDLKI